MRERDGRRGTKARGSCVSETEIVLRRLDRGPIASRSVAAAQLETSKTLRKYYNQLWLLAKTVNNLSVYLAHL